MEQSFNACYGEDTRRGTQSADESGDDKRRIEPSNRGDKFMEIMKTVWIVNYYTNIPDKVGNPRHYEFAKYLTERGYTVRVFFADKKRVPLWRRKK